MRLNITYHALMFNNDTSNVLTMNGAWRGVAMSIENLVDPSRELDAMRNIADALAKLDDSARRRVLHWANDAFGSRASVSFMHGERGLDSITSAGGSDLKVKYPTLADFFDAAAPSQDADKALVVGYWFQVIEGASDLDGFSLNKELKHLGHGISNITSALDTLISRKPALVLQTKKSGTSKQARKKYRLTLEGQRSVERMINQNMG